MSSVPHGGVLINKMIDLETSRTLITECHYEIELNERQLCDVECIMDGAFSPLQGFMTEMEYNSVVGDMKIAVNEEQSVIFGLPVVFDLSKQEDIENMVPGKSVLLKYNHLPIAIFNISSQYVPNKVMEAQKCYGTTSIEHPAVYMITAERGNVYCGGEILGLNKPPRDVPCRTPLEVRKDLVAYFDNLNVDKQDRDVIAFQCRNPIHKAHYELILRALKAPNVSPNAILLIHPTVGPTQHDDIPGALRYQTYVQLKKEVNNPKLFWDYLPYNMHMAGPREAIQHMIIRKNFGCTHFVIGRDMAGCKSSLSGEIILKHMWIFNNIYLYIHVLFCR